MKKSDQEKRVLSLEKLFDPVMFFLFEAEEDRMLYLLHSQFKMGFFLIMLGTIFLQGTQSSGTVASENYWLIMPQEAALPPAPTRRPAIPGDLPFDIGREDLGLGPIIEVVKPNQKGPIKSPAGILVHFEKRLASINLESLKVTLVKFFAIDITDRVKPYVSIEGIDIPEAPLPSGEHQLRLALEDAEGNMGVKELMLKIQ